MAALRLGLALEWTVSGMHANANWFLTFVIVNL